MAQLGGRFARPRRRWLRAGLVQLLCALAGLMLGLLLPRISFDATVASSRVTDALVAVGFGADADGVKRLGDKPAVIEFAVGSAKIEIAAKAVHHALVTGPMTATPTPH